MPKIKYGSNMEHIVTILECSFLKGFLRGSKFSAKRKDLPYLYSPWFRVTCKAQERVLGGHFQTQAVLVFCHCQHWRHQHRVIRKGAFSI